MQTVPCIRLTAWIVYACKQPARAAFEGTGKSEYLGIYHRARTVLDSRQVLPCRIPPPVSHHSNSGAEIILLQAHLLTAAPYAQAGQVHHPVVCSKSRTPARHIPSSLLSKDAYIVAEACLAYIRKYGYTDSDARLFGAAR